MPNEDLDSLTLNSATLNSTTNAISGTAISGTVNTASNNINWTGNSGYNLGSFINTSVYNDYLYNTKNPLEAIIIEFLSEEELIKLLDIVNSRCTEEKDFQAMIVYIIENRHCSEAFILKYLKYENLDKALLLSILKERHAAEINTGEYAQLALLVHLD